MNKIFADILYIILILFVIGLGIYAIIWMKGNGYQCVKDPLEYFTSRTGDVCFCHGQLGFVP